MATNSMNGVIQHLRNAVLPQEGADLTDGQLLESFVSRREAAALEALVQRHAPMVWGVCRRILPHHQDAEDAFQAAFLVLVRKAASIQPREMVANWLYGVAHQTALKARATTARRRGRERQVRNMPEPETVQRHDLWPDLQPLLDEELSRLPDKYRIAIVLCDLEGKTRKAAARQLGVPDGTLAARLARGRKMLAKRLARHDLSVSGGTLAAVLSHEAASACAPSAVVISTSKAVAAVAAGQTAAAGLISARVAALAEGVVKTMMLTKLKVATAVLLVVGIACYGIGSLTYTAMARQGRNKEVGPSGRVENAPGTERQREAIAVRDAKREDGLADWPADAPIELRPRVAQTALDPQVAEKKARQYLGINKTKELRLAPAYLSDNDFPFLRPHKQAVWLAAVKDLKVPTPGGKPQVVPQLYLAIDADTGQLIEAFTPPARPWWREKKQVVGPAHENYLRETGQTLERPAGRPKLTVTDALQGMVEESGQGQIIVRYAVYSNRNAGQMQGNQFVPAADRRPSLLVFREGLRMRSTGPPPGGEVVGRSMIVLDARTGAPLYNESSGN